MDYTRIANSPAMWIACAVAVSLIVVQAFLMTRKSYQAGKKIGLSEKTMKSAMRSSAISSIGPSIVILTNMLALFVTVGVPMGWLRLSFIGSVMFESIAAGFGMSAVGVTMGSDAVTDVAFANAVWTMVLCSIGWIIFATLSADKMDKVQKKLAGGSMVLLSVISGSAILGVFASFCGTHLVKLDKNSIACIAGGVIMLVLMPLAEKKNIRWLKEWALAFSLFGGMLVAVAL